MHLKLMVDDKTLTSTRSRLDEINRELADLHESQSALKSRWDVEKRIITEIQNLKAEIEAKKVQSDEFERQGNLGKVAEIRYGTLLELDKKLKTANERLTQIQSNGKLLREEVDSEDIAEVVSKWTGIPVNRMLETERTKLIKMEERIHQRVVAQEEAVTAISNAIRRTRAGLQDANRPIGSFIFLGTTGVGKTEMARALAEFLFDDENSLVRIDMSEYMEKFAVSRLIGAPPGYVGYEEGGQLTEAIRRKPYSVVLLDEIEKANPEVFNVLLQVLDEGHLTDSKGRKVNFKNTIIIMTSNLGTDIIQDKISDIDDTNRDEILARMKSSIINLLKQRMRPEFLNRIDEIILFKPLTKSDIHAIANLQLNLLRDKMSHLGITVEFTEDALDWLTSLGFDIHYGARPLKRTIQKHIADPFAVQLLESKFVSGDKVKIDAGDDGNFKFEKM